MFDGAVAIVTGAASGIGRALSEELARRGASVVLTDIDAEVHDVAGGMPAAAGRTASAAILDVTDYDGVQRLVDGVAAEHGRLDFVFNNAGIGVAGELREHTIAAWNRIIDVNIRGVVHGVQAAYPLMLRQGFGHIVNTASMAGLTPGPMLASYSMTKHAVVGLSKALRVEAAAAGQRTRVVRMFERLRPMDARRFAGKVLDQVARNRAIIIVPGWWKILWWLERLAPTLNLVLVERLSASARRELYAPVDR
ncbi:MAG: SDR family oxidoreductase [Deltaproteobacteria bacterium]|nr:MAG: SDR family oxidoreductase [Deltaproteobacteria bacterium]